MHPDSSVGGPVVGRRLNTGHSNDRNQEAGMCESAGDVGTVPGLGRSPPWTWAHQSPASVPGRRSAAQQGAGWFRGCVSWKSIRASSDVSSGMVNPRHPATDICVRLLRQRCGLLQAKDCAGLLQDGFRRVGRMSSLPRPLVDRHGPVCSASLCHNAARGLTSRAQPTPTLNR